jgi:glucose/arabinose dehydrogenase
MELDARSKRTLVVFMAAALLSCHGGGSDPPSTPPPSSTSGLDQRPSNLTCIAPARATGNSTLSVQRAFPNLTFLEPVAMLQAPGDDSRWFVVEQNGIVRVFANQPNVATSQVFMDIDDRVVQLSQSEAGMLGLAFHPSFPANNRVYVNYSSQSTGAFRSVTSEFTSPDGGLTIDPNSERVLLSVNKNFDNHNGGQLAFGPNDGFLYLGLGDGGGGNDPSGNAQNPQRLLGKMLRIDVSSQPGGAPYAIPSGASGNPFAANPRCNVDGTGTQSCPEIFALGLRNPWRCSFDMAGTRELFCADVQQDSFEEVNIITRGANYGWRRMEGDKCFDYVNPKVHPATCDKTGLTEPIIVYKNCTAQPQGCLGISITGGYVYRGAHQPWQGKYIFGDWSKSFAEMDGQIFFGTKGADGKWTMEVAQVEGTKPIPYILAFAQDERGEVYALTSISTGPVGGHDKIYRIVPAN